MDENKFNSIVESLIVGAKINDLVDTLSDVDAVKCALCAAIDCWCMNHLGDVSEAIFVLEDMVEMMKDAHERRGE